jgi:HD-GYP domain-containing protein (c-di-GMP phosphodiesterase class II)
MGGGARQPQVRLAELVAALSLGVDLGFGQPMEHVLRQCLIALRLADHAGLSEQDRVAVYYTALLVNVGCHSDAHEQAKWFGDDIKLKSGKYAHDFGSLRGTLATMRLVGAGNPPLHRFRVGLEFALSGHRQLDGMISQHARLARALAEQLELPGQVREAVGAAYEQWDGRGWPGDLRGEAVPAAARMAQFAEFLEVAHRVGGTQSATALARRQAGKQFDPALAALVCARAEEIFGGLEATPAWQTVIAAEPALAVELSEAQLDSALAAIANFVDLKSPFTLGHSAAVADLAGEAGHRLRLPREEVLMLRRAGLVHGFGRLGVSNAIWDRPGPLSAGEWERIRIYPYLTEPCCTRRLPWRRSARWRSSTVSGWTAADTREGFLAARSPAQPGCSGQRTPTSRCVSPGRTGPRGPLGRRPRKCRPKSALAAWTARPSMPCSRRPAIASHAAGKRLRA